MNGDKASAVTVQEPTSIGTHLCQEPNTKAEKAESIFNTESMRPVVGSDFLVTRQFPDEVQGQFIYACVINMNGLPRWTFSDEGWWL